MKKINARLILPAMECFIDHSADRLMGRIIWRPLNLIPLLCGGGTGRASYECIGTPGTCYARRLDDSCTFVLSVVSFGHLTAFETDPSTDRRTQSTRLGVRKFPYLCCLSTGLYQVPEGGLPSLQALLGTRLYLTRPIVSTEYVACGHHAAGEARGLYEGPNPWTMKYREQERGD